MFNIANYPVFFNCGVSFGIFVNVAWPGGNGPSITTSGGNVDLSLAPDQCPPLGTQCSIYVTAEHSSWEAQSGPLFTISDPATVSYIQMYYLDRNYYFGRIF